MIYNCFVQCQNISLIIKMFNFFRIRGLERRPCPKCHASRKYYCYVCYVTVGLDRSLIPTVHLPIKVDM